MNQQIASTASGNNGESTARDLFALTDEQILEIEPEAQNVEVSGGQPPASGQESPQVAPASLPAGSNATAQNDNRPDQNRGATSSPSSAAATEPPPWLAAQMKDPWTGEEARELWNGVQQAQSEAAAYRAAFANPEDARALKELYPGGVTEARAAAERARVLDDIDRSYFGVTGKSAQEVSASRAELAQRMLRENPTAFREMVFAGLRALESAGVGATLGSPGADGAAASAGAASPAPTATAASSSRDLRTTDSQTQEAGHEAHLAAYASFEKATNEDLERSVGGAIERTLAQALPNVGRSSQDASSRAGQAPPLQARLSQAIRQDVEAALEGDRQLGEQVAQILSGHRLDAESRAQVVRLIGERAQQLVPAATKRVLSDWTQTTLAAHRSNTARTDAASARREVAPVSAERPRSLTGNSVAATPPPGGNEVRKTSVGRVNYRKLSDEQILDL
jgi:hypothetical protein